MTTVPKPADPANGFTAIYDAWNWLVKLQSGETTVAEYEYDGKEKGDKSNYRPRLRPGGQPN